MEDKKITMPAVALRGLTILPGMVQHFDISREKSIRAIETAMMGNQKVYLVTQRHPEQETPAVADLYQMGTISQIKQLVKMPGGIIRVMVEGEKRAALLTLFEEGPYLEAEVAEAPMQEEQLTDTVKEAMSRIVKEKLEEFGNANPKAVKDFIGSLLVITDLEQLLTQTANEFPWDFGLNLFLNNRDHRKITVIDGKVGFTGGYNLANEYFNYTHPYGQWKDTGIRLEGDAVQSLTVTFLEMWNAVSEKATNDTDFSKYIIHYDYKAQQTGFVQPYADSPMDNEQVGEEVYISMINKAENYCWFMTPYLIITDEMTHALCLAAKRGVDVRIITPGIPDKKFIYNITRSFYHGLVKHGVRVYEWTPGFCHAKMSIVDNCMATCGTINLDYRSLYHHFENGCFMADCQAVVEIKNDLIRTMGECRDVTDQYCTGRSAYLRLGQLFMRLFAGLL